MGKNLTKYRRTGEPVYQGATSAHCWAAALEYWLKVTPNRSKIAKDDLIRMYAKKFEDGSLDPVTEFPRVKSENGMESQNISGASLTEDYVYEKLGLGHLYIGYEVPGKKYGHVIVVYGLQKEMINFMDPAKGMHYYRSLSYYSDTKMTVAWPTPTPTTTEKAGDAP